MDGVSFPHATAKSDGTSCIPSNENSQELVAGLSTRSYCPLTLKGGGVKGGRPVRVTVKERQRDRETDRQRDRQTGRQAGRQTDLLYSLV